MDYSYSEAESPEAELLVLPDSPAAAAVRDLAPGARIVGMTKGQFSMLDLLKAVLEKIGPAHLQLSTWTQGVRDTENAGFLLRRGKLLSVRILVDRSFATRQPAYAEAVRKTFGNDAIRCTRTHAKIALLRNDDWAISIRSSMNLNRNPRFEQFDIDDSVALYDFFSAHFEEMSVKMPSGASVPTHEVDEVFKACGIDPDRATPVPAGPTDQTAQIMDLLVQGCNVDEIRTHAAKHWNLDEKALREHVDEAADRFVHRAQSMGGELKDGICLAIYQDILKRASDTNDLSTMLKVADRLRGF